MGHVYPQEKESEEMVESLEAERQQQTEGSLCLWGKERLRDIDVRREERDEERQLGMERRLLALKRERDDEAKEREMMRAWEGKNSHRGRRKEGRRKKLVWGKREREKLKSNENT